MVENFDPEVVTGLANIKAPNSYIVWRLPAQFSIEIRLNILYLYLHLLALSMFVFGRISLSSMINKYNPLPNGKRFLLNLSRGNKIMFTGGGGDNFSPKYIRNIIFRSN